MRTKRKNIVLKENQKNQLKEIAYRKGVSESAIINIAISEYIERNTKKEV